MSEATEGTRRRVYILAAGKWDLCDAHLDGVKVGDVVKMEEHDGEPCNTPEAFLVMGEPTPCGNGNGTSVQSHAFEGGASIPYMSAFAWVWRARVSGGDEIAIAIAIADGDRDYLGVRDGWRLAGPPGSSPPCGDKRIPATKRAFLRMLNTQWAKS